MEKPLVSVLMTAYNREKYIANAIESVLASTYTHFELIIVDDCSIDNTLEIARNFESKDLRIKVYTNEKNLGDYLNRNKAVSYAKGKYLKFLDSDDLIYPFGLEQLVYFMERFPDAGYGLCSISPDKNKIFPFQLNPDMAFHCHYFSNSIFNRAPLSSIIKTNSFLQVGGFDNIRMAGDFNMWHKLSLTYPVVLMPQGIVWYRVHDDQEMNLFKLYLMHYLSISEYYLNLDICPLERKVRKKLLLNIKNKQRKLILKCLLNLDLKLMKIYFKSKKDTIKTLSESANTKS